MEAMEEPRPTMFVVDDNLSFHEMARGVGQILDLPVASYLTAEAFLASGKASHPGCLLLDIQLPGMTGLELFDTIAAQASTLPVILISAHASVRIAVEAMRRGAVALLEKPCQLSELIALIREALRRDAEGRAERERERLAAGRLARLTVKEREVLELVSAGKTNKDIAAALQLSIRAVEDRRSRLMRKLGAGSIVDLIRQFSP